MKSNSIIRAAVGGLFLIVSCVGLKATTLASAQVSTIRLRLLKIGALVRVTTPKVWVRMASSYPCQALFTQVLRQLRT